jgi:hypothetical protein
MSINFIEICNLRTEFEEISSDFNMSVSGSCINTLKWFAEHGFRSNRLRNGYDRAIEIANIILAEYENGRGREENWTPSG